MQKGGIDKAYEHYEKAKAFFESEANSDQM